MDHSIALSMQQHFIPILLFWCVSQKRVLFVLITIKIENELGKPRELINHAFWRLSRRKSNGGRVPGQDESGYFYGTRVGHVSSSEKEVEDLMF